MVMYSCIEKAKWWCGTTSSIRSHWKILLPIEPIIVHRQKSHTNRRWREIIYFTLNWHDFDYLHWMMAALVLRILFYVFNDLILTYGPSTHFTTFLLFRLMRCPSHVHTIFRFGLLINSILDSERVNLKTNKPLCYQSRHFKLSWNVQKLNFRISFTHY